MKKHKIEDINFKELVGKKGFEIYSVLFQIIEKGEKAELTKKQIVNSHLWLWREYQELEINKEMIIKRFEGDYEGLFLRHIHCIIELSKLSKEESVKKYCLEEMRKLPNLLMMYFCNSHNIFGDVKEFMLEDTKDIR